MTINKNVTKTMALALGTSPKAEVLNASENRIQVSIEEGIITVEYIHGVIVLNILGEEWTKDELEEYGELRHPDDPYFFYHAVRDVIDEVSIG